MDDQPLFKTPLTTMVIIALLISTILILSTIPLGLQYGHYKVSGVPASYERYREETGLPLNWFSINYYILDDTVLIEKLDLWSPLHLIINFMLYFILIFGALFLIRRFRGKQKG
jgi:hypothetical protein